MGQHRRCAGERLSKRVDFHGIKLAPGAADWPVGRDSCDARRVDKALVAAALAALVLPACRASVNVNAKATTEEQPQEAASEPPPAPALPPPVVLQTAYFGVARSLTLKPSDRQPPCKCVVAAVGASNDPSFDWHGPAPSVGSDALVVAVSADGVTCDTQGRGPSIAAIDRVGQDVVVVLEEFKETRPLALGAIIPNPGAGGRIFLRARGKTPYGRPLAGGVAGPRGDLCQIGQGTEGATAPPPDDSSDE